jgi:hypothetical protein
VTAPAGGSERQALGGAPHIELLVPPELPDTPAAPQVDELAQDMAAHFT